MTPACMGGWCQHREHCAAYHQADRAEVMERQCVKGQEAPVAMRVIPIEEAA